MIENESGLSVSLHEAGHLALAYWGAESLHETLAYLYPGGRVTGRMVWPCFEINEWDLMILIAGHLTDSLARGITPAGALRIKGESRLKNSDSARIRKLVMLLCNGQDDRRYNFAVQERTRRILQQPPMWKAIQVLAARLYADGAVSGYDCETIFRICGASGS
jgi:hypothetical protein